MNKTTPHEHAGRFALLCAAVLLTAACARAVVDANSRSNTTAPPDGAPWANMGHVNGSGGTYVGNGWVLTAAHVGAGNTEFNGTLFQFDGNSRRLTNSDGTATDMVMFHVSPPPNLPPMGLAVTTPAALTPVDLIGFGYISGSSVTNIAPSYTGFLWSPAQFKSWGNNKVKGGLTTLDEGLGPVTLLATDFTSPTTGGSTAATSDEAEAAPGDSGGAVFAHPASGWQLVGMIDLIGQYPDQSPAASAAFGNETYAADIATYRSQIIAWMSSTAPVLFSAKSGTNLMVCWPDTGIAYDLTSTTSLPPPVWTAVPQAQFSTNGQRCVLVPAIGNARFFRLEQKQVLPGRH